MDMLENMRTFVRVVQAGSFTAVARQTNVAIAQVSRAVSGLEEYAQIRLLHRTTRRISLTDSGRRYFERLLSILGDVDQANAEARNALVQPYGRLRVHTMPGLGQSHVVESIVAYQAAFPEVAVAVTYSQRIPNLVEEGYDVSIVAASSLPDSTYVAHSYGESHSVLVASKAYLARRGVPSKPADLADHTCLCLDNLEGPSNEWLLHGAGDQVVTHSILSAPFQANSPEAMTIALRAGLGIGPLAMYSVAADLRSGRLVRVLPEYRLAMLSIYAMYPSRQFVDAKVKTFLDSLRMTLSPALKTSEDALSLAGM
ncbi:LysR family transcriptional regulator [Burkholderia cenocepacia]|uniref:LysR family transcriptional regulator n=1 Tax=Burkholderia cenocepacia TaxID=95486 RepID=A0A6B2MR94_9BURK|nr:LysR family transcriptional regulator [Burkholderia cenocepacia]MBN3505798.1 LysR family transcriptional regulator [Burkholderia cenocepacia]MCO1392612.1 LysR family transcriptional regulator [Burkholderia cenocepacia]MCO1406571.1 LysR family transcriptional regulator [Burkholderia cenocepacia]MDI9675689.1 LysR family transcriptional regulator [Burkholderia cenocepacia]NDV76587.1 LysR family transcriptional regulator [Burkholderia cenocepacia]